MKSWNIIPMSEENHLCVIQEKDGNIVATTPREYADVIGSLPEIVSTLEATFEGLKDRYPNWTKESLMGRLEDTIARIRAKVPSGSFH